MEHAAMSQANHEDARNSGDGDYTLNDVEFLRKGIIKTSKNKANTPYTILLVGETGVGKSSVLEFIANILIGKDIDHYDFEILDDTNEQNGSDNQSQTNSARLYEFKSKNDISVRVLDTPGLADTRGLQQDELHKRSIATQIENHIASVTAVLILADGTVPRVTVGTDYALSTLSAIFPKTLTRNIAFMFTNVLSPLHWNFSGDSVPDSLKDAPSFLLNNPIALQKKYLKLRDDPNMKKTGFRNAVKASEENAVEMLVELFDWLDGLEPQPTMGTVSNASGSMGFNSPSLNYANAFFPGFNSSHIPYSMPHVHASRLQRQSDNTANALPRSVGNYGGNAIRLPKQSHTNMGKKGVSRKQLGNIRRRFKQWGLDLWRQSQEKVWEGIRTVKQVYFYLRT